eukprot:1158395-Pelagomonas_calceolata.AAC.4
MGMAGMSSTGSSRSRGGSKQSSMAAYISQMVAAGALPSCPDWAKPSRGEAARVVTVLSCKRQWLAAVIFKFKTRPDQDTITRTRTCEWMERI